MRREARRQSPALLISLIALFAALGGTVYAAKKIDGRTIRVRSLPGNRLKPRSVAADRLKPGVLAGVRLRAPLTGADINELTLGRVPSATHAETADSARSAVDAETALNAVNAIDARTVNGHGVGCLPGTRPFAGACWEASPNGAATAPAAAAGCAARGGTLPEALQLAAFAALPDVSLDPGDEWSGDLANVTGLNLYSAVTISKDGEINFTLSSNTRQYRCVMPIVT